MYESEIYPGKGVQAKLPEEALKQSRELRGRIVKRSILHWSEHCTECAIPSCYTTCNLYTPRADGKCQRFEGGIIRHDIDGQASEYFLEINFKKWGNLSTQANANLYDPKEILKAEKEDLKTSRLISKSFPSGVKRKLIKKRYSVKKNKIINLTGSGVEEPDSFELEAFNPNDVQADLTLTFRNDDRNIGKLPFQYKVELIPGYNHISIPYDEISKRISTDKPFRISLVPNNEDDVLKLYFGILDFVSLVDTQKKPAKSRKVKCVVWDLDNTLWDGILIEDGAGGIRLREGVPEMIKDLDGLGILQSVASKNNESDAREVLEKEGLWEYFLYPQISWGAKSRALKRIAENLNINLNTFLFVDDSTFEREEVYSVFPQVRSFDGNEYLNVMDLDDFRGIPTEEGRKRRLLYRNEEERKSAVDSFDGEYMSFLQSCNITLEIGEINDRNMQRVNELTQRTNQMNFSGNIYQPERLKEIHEDPSLDSFVLKCKDKFGDYGIIGFSVVDTTKPELIDLMFSCRIQSKRVEHAFMTWLLKRYAGQHQVLNVRYKHTDRNQFSAQVFEDFGFRQTGQEENLRLLEFDLTSEIPDDGIMEVKES